MKIPTATKIDGAVRWKSATLNQTIGRTKEEINSPIHGGLYVHVPFCRNKCSYCHFYVLPYDAARTESYLESIQIEWQMRKCHIDHLDTLYIGGGTPSLLPIKALEQLLSIFPKIDGEITIEANPEDVTQETMEAYRSLGINRVSIGVQTLDDHLLNFLDRRHSAKKAIEAVEITRRAGFTNISIDLMYDLPSQSTLTFIKSLERAITLPITHLSLYNLTFEKGSLFYKQQAVLSKQLPSEEESLEMIDNAVKILERGGLKRYEISAFAKEGCESNHNMSYWLGKPFIGLGPSAFSYTYGSRHQNIANLSKWSGSLRENRDPTDFSEALPEPANYLELLAIRLRLLEGADLTDFPPFPASTLASLEQNVLDGLLEKSGTTYKLSARGTLFYDTIASSII